MNTPLSPGPERAIPLCSSGYLFLLLIRPTFVHSWGTPVVVHDGSTQYAIFEIHPAGRNDWTVADAAASSLSNAFRFVQKIAQGVTE